MNLYLVVFVVLAITAVLEWLKPEYEQKLYWISWILMTACLCFRYGQGTDYVTYHNIYDSIPVIVDFEHRYFFGVYPEIGWRILSLIFRSWGAPFWVFTMILGLAEMLLLNRFLQKLVPLKVFGLFMLYPVLFLVYMVSGLRQGLAMCIFLGAAVPFYLDKKWIQYIAVVLFTSVFHRVGLTWVILVGVYYLPMKVICVFAGVFAAGGIVLQIQSVQQLILNLVSAYHVQQFLTEGSSSILAIGERLTAFLALIVIYMWVRHRDGRVDHRTELLLKAYMCGVCIYMLLCSNSYYASRYGAIFKVLECSVFALLVQKKDTLCKAAAGFFFALTLLMGVKNLNAMIQESYFAAGGYNIWNCPYVSVFNRDEINQYIPYDERKEILSRNLYGDQEMWRLEQ